MIDDAAADRVRTLCDEAAEAEFRTLMQVTAGWPGREAFLHHVLTASDQDVFLDYLAELRYALVFRGLGFSVRFEPCGATGPDLEVMRDGRAAMVEVAKFRSRNPGPPLRDPDILEEYGNPERDIAKSIAKVRHKFNQARGDLYVVAIWNGDDDLEELEMQFAVQRLALRSECPLSLQFVLYGSPWVGRQQLHCFRTSSMLADPLSAWKSDLGQTTVMAAVRRAVEGT